MTAAWRLSSVVVCVLAIAGCDVANIAAQSDRARGTFERTLTVNGPVDLSVRTGSGDIAIRTGADDRVRVVSARTGSGSIDTAQPLQVQGTRRRNHVDGVVRGGGNRVDITTGSGSIDIR